MLEEMGGHVESNGIGKCIENVGSNNSWSYHLHYQTFLGKDGLMENAINEVISFGKDY
jgi:hypothetical protein